MTTAMEATLGERGAGSFDRAADSCGIERYVARHLDLAAPEIDDNVSGPLIPLALRRRGRRPPRAAVTRWGLELGGPTASA